MPFAQAALTAPPAGCEPTHLPSYSEYGLANVKAVWDDYSSKSLGACAYGPGKYPSTDCNNAVQLSRGNQIFYICWWGLKAQPAAPAPAANIAQPLRTSASISDFASLDFGSSLSTALGSGTSTILFIVGTDNTYVTVTDGKVTGTSKAGSALAPDFTIQMSQDAFLSLVNAYDKESTLKRMLAAGAISISSSNAAKQAAIRTALSSGALNAPAFGPGSTVSLNGQNGIAAAWPGFSNIFTSQLGNDKAVLNNFGSPVGWLSNVPPALTTPPAGTNIYFNKPPGIWAQQPGLIYDTVSKSPNAVGPWNIFKINPGLIGPDKILQLNPGLIGPADMALLNPGLSGPAQFAYLMGIGAHSNTANTLQGKGLTNSPFTGMANRWGQQAQNVQMYNSS
ncbi:MAG: hypothetical protein WC759_03075 [Candidatus Micrarchaeia archaeon]|jgi:hypothetical protein